MSETTTQQRTTMGGKPVYSVPAKTIINFNSGFKEKLLCDGPTFSAGTACQFSCSFCYVPAIMAKSPHLEQARRDGKNHSDIVIRRSGALEAVEAQLRDSKGRAKYLDPDDKRVIYASPLVDVASNMELVRETIEVCKSILSLTNWHIRLLSKSNLLPKIAQAFDGYCITEDAKKRIIYGVSTGTLDDKLAQAFEGGTPLVSKRIQSLHWLQDNGYRTFGMVCPSLPQRDYFAFAKEMAEAIRVDRCEHVWAEVVNVRGESMTRTVAALRSHGFEWEAGSVERISSSRMDWEGYSRSTFVAHTTTIPPEKLRFLQYVNKDNSAWWNDKAVASGAVLLGKLAHS